MRIFVPLILCVFALTEVNTSKNGSEPPLADLEMVLRAQGTKRLIVAEQNAEKSQNLQTSHQKREAESSRKDSHEAKPSTTLLQTVAFTEPGKPAAHHVGQKDSLTEKKPELVPLSYEFSYGTPSHSHVQNQHPSGIIEGRYVIHAPNGQHRTVDYVADEGGFRAGVATNEPGTKSASGGGSTFVSTASEFSTNHVEHQQLAPLRIIDIQPFPAPLVRYEVLPGHPAPAPVQLLHPSNNIEQLPLQTLPPQPPARQLIHSHVFSQQPPVDPQQFLVNPEQVPLLSPPDFHVIEQSDVTGNGSPPNRISLPNSLVASTHANSVGRFSNLQEFSRAPPIVTHTPQLLQRPPPLQAPGLFTAQPTIQVAPPPAVQPPPIALEAPSPQVHSAPPQTHHATLHQNSPRAPPEVYIENARPQADIEHITSSRPRHPVANPPPGETLRPARIQRPRPDVLQSAKSLRMPTIQPTNDAQVFEVKTKVIDHGEVPFNNDPRQLTRDLPFNGPILAAIKVADFSKPRERVRNPKAIFKNLPPPPRRPPPSAFKQSQPLIFLAVPPSSQVPKPQPRPKIPDISKLFDAMPGPTVHDVAMHEFFNNIKEHHQNEVQFVKKHEHEFQALASRVVPFLLKKRMSAAPHVHPHRSL